MYHITDKRAAIREIQKYLHFISDRVTNEVPRIAIDGIFGEETKEAVKAFQKYKGIEESGTVGYETFLLLHEDFLRAEFLYNTESYVIEKELFPFEFGDSGNEVLFLNIMLSELQDVYTNIYTVELVPYYTHSTEKAVKDLRRIFKLEESVLVDFELYDRMKYELLIRAAE